MVTAPDVEVIHLQMKGSQLDKKDFFGKSDPYLDFTVVHRTEVIKNTLNPTWAPFRATARALCNGDYDRSILVKCWDWNSNGNPELIGEFSTNLRELTRGPGPTNAYEVSLLTCRVEQEYSFLDYIQSGDKLFPALGFGARFPDMSVQHEFALNFTPQNPYCNGIQGVLGAYNNAIKSVQLYGPTNFAPCINHVAKFAATKRDGSCYFVLLIITDGVISDMPQTMQAIVNSYDIQFVPFREFSQRYGNSSVAVAQAALAREVLAEIPEQVTSYMKMNGFLPRQPSSHAPSAPPPVR
ncbi:CPNE8-like protein [Mya arenaria]|uniref:CPNE8-like protein n=1 Tax=Mya arenaria TaxID=6604 RepID=A0ABY7G0G7_MYAAR|nr:CPNE8-like protein [Mya arenaria]